MERDLYGLNTLNVRPKSILEQIQTCVHPKQLEWVVKNLIQGTYPSMRTLSRWQRAIKVKQKELGIQVMISE